MTFNTYFRELTAYTDRVVILSVLELLMNLVTLRNLTQMDRRIPSSSPGPIGYHRGTPIRITNTVYAESPTLYYPSAR